MIKFKRYIIKKINHIILSAKVTYNIIELRGEREREINREIKKLIITKGG